MNIPPLETILADLDEARRQRNASNRRIEELTDALDNAGMIIERLTNERDELKAQWAYYQDFCKSHNAKGITDLVVQRDAALRVTFDSVVLEKMNAMETALREAKEALVMNIVGTGGRTPAAHNAIATINKVLGEE